MNERQKSRMFRALVALGTITFGAMARSQGIPANLGQRLDIEFPGGSLSDAIKLVHQKAGIDLMADAFLTDGGVGKRSFKDATLKEVLEYMAFQSQRDLFFQNGFVVFRHSQWYIRPLQDEYSRRMYGLRWKEAGLAEVRPVGSKPNAQSTDPEPERLAMPKAGLVSAAEALPPRSIDCEFDLAPLSLVAARMRSMARVKLQVAPKYSERRISCQARHVSPAQFADALRLLLFGDLEIALSQTNAQAKREGELIEGASSSLTTREKLSRDLEPEIAKALTPAQRAAFEAGEEVVLNIGTMNAGLGERASKYVLDLYGDIAAKTPGVPELDRSRLRECSIVLKRGWGRLGVNAFRLDGGGLHF